MNRWLVASITLTVVGFAAALTAFYGYRDQMAETIPVHWGITGEPDAWVQRDSALVQLLLLPGLMTLMIGLSLVLPYLSPKEFRIERFNSTYWYMMFLVTMLFGWIQFVVIAAAFEWNLPIVRLLIAGIFLMLALMGNVMGRVKRNWWMGVRTPWTLASEVVWNQTHRLAAWVFFGCGLFGFVGVLIGLPFIACMVLVLLIAFVPILYSLVLYKRLERRGQL